MIDIFKEKSGSSLVVRICGAIDETVDFDKLLGPPPPEFRIISKDVTRINSNGVKAWIKYFRSAQKAGTKITFAECATSIVEQINLVSNFVCGGTVESIYLPYSCFSCRNEFVGLAQVTDLKAGVDRFKVFKCPSCAGEARFDEIAAEYFAFLKRSP